MIMRLAIPRKLAAYYVSDYLLSTAIIVVQAPFLKLVGITPLEYGILGAINYGCGVVSTLYGGLLADRYRAFNVMALSFVLFTAGVLMIATGVKLWIFVGMAVRGLSSFGTLTLRVAVSRIFSEREYERVYSNIYSLSLLGQGIGAFSGWLPYALHVAWGVPLFESYRYTMIACSLGSLATLYLLYMPEIVSCRGGEKVSLLFDRELAKKLARFIVARGFLTLAAFTAVQNARYYFVLKFNAQSNALGTLRGAECLALASLMNLSPRVKKKLGSSVKAFVALSFANAPLLFLVTLAPSFPIAAAIYVVRTVVANLGAPLLTSFTMRLIPREWRGRGLSMIRLSMWGFAIPGRILGGDLMGIDLDLPFTAGAIFYAVGYTLFLTLLRKMESEVERKSGARKLSGTPTR